MDGAGGSKPSLVNGSSWAQPADLSISASILTIVTTSVSLAQYIRQLAQDYKQQDVNAKELEKRLDILNTALGTASSAYGPQGNQSSSSDEEHLRQHVRCIVVEYKCDLERVRSQLKKQMNQKNWLSLAWRQQHAAPALARIERSISERQKQLEFLVQLLQGHEQRLTRQQLRNISSQLQEIAKTCHLDHPLSITPTGTEVPDADITPSYSEAQSGDTRFGSQEIPETQEKIGDQEDGESDPKGTSLLNAIRDGDKVSFESHFLDGDTSFQEKDDKDRTPLLLAASLDRKDMVNKFLATDQSFTSPKDAGSSGDSDSTNHREIDVNMVDSLGRSALHYCAEFNMRVEAEILLDHGAEVNVRDKSDYPPAYYAAKKRRTDTLKLLKDRGADTEFELQIPTSVEINTLLEETSGDD